MNAASLLLVDGSSYLFRAYHALPPLTGPHGEPTGALYGVLNMLRKLLSENPPQHLAVVFDARGPTFRDELFADYKAQRPAMPEDLASQIEPLHACVEALGLPLLCVSGVEADDVIGTLARQAAAEGMEVTIVTGDKDMAQLVDGRITLLDTMKNLRLDAAAVEERFGVPPERIIDYLALMGDSSDNIPGVPGVGAKTAARWLQQYGSLDAIIDRAEEIKGKVGEKLRANLEQLELSRRLATIRCDVPLEHRPRELVPDQPDGGRLRELYRRYGFRRWLQELDRPDPPETAHLGTDANDGNGDATDDPPASEYETVLDAETLKRWLQRLESAELFAFDTETTSLDYLAARIVGVSFAAEPGQAAYVPLAHVYPGAPAQLDRDEVLERLRPLLEDPERAKLGQNLKYDRHVLANHGIDLAGIRHDTMLASYVLDATATRHDLDSLARHYLERGTIQFEDIAGKGARQLSFDQIELEPAARYAAEDADLTLQLHRTLWPRLRHESALRDLYQDLEIPLVPVLCAMERRGVRIDGDRLRQHSRELAKRMDELERDAHREAGRPFNLGSPKQLQEILFEEQGLPTVKKTPKGQPSTAEDVLAELAERGHELPRLILEHRALSKLRSTYTDKLPRLVNPDTGRVHTSFHQAVTSTGRLSSSDPNLQNIPIRRPEGRRIRQAFVAAEGCRLLAADYSQIELRIMAHLSGDAGLLDAFAEDADIHRRTAAEVFGLEPDAVAADQRRAAKAINFGLIYGMSAFGLARQLGIERDAAQDYVDRYFERYPGVHDYMNRTRREAAERGYVETVFGRRLYLPEIRSRNHQRRQAAERTAINA
ncbi:MAG: DNA polymerase I, partial [Candidatus Competibacterales bacterium]|nr:DNA polymerase I [Candidatus Competibacterales bacterium]